MIIQQDVGSFGLSTDAYIALHPAQIKSATDNIGTFDRKNPDIRYSRELDSEYMELAKDPEGNGGLRELAEEFYGETVSDEEINPPDIVMSAGV